MVGPSLSYPLWIGVHMNDIIEGCKVVCVDATRLPIHVRGAALTDFEFPGGMLGEGTVCLVERCAINPRGRVALWIAGFSVLHCGREIVWDGIRYRKFPDATRSSFRRSARVSSEQLVTLPA